MRTLRGSNWISCSARINPFATFSGQGVQYIDDVGSWATVEPADDYTIPTVLIFARLASQQ
jgi:hypothetical protein